MVPKVYGVDKELDPHRQPEQQYLGKGVIPKRGSHTPRIVTEEVSDPVRDTSSQISMDNPVEAVRVVPQRSLQSHVLLPRLKVRAHHKGDTVGRV